jgi:hypothetical protein
VITIIIKDGNIKLSFLCFLPNLCHIFDQIFIHAKLDDSLIEITPSLEGQAGLLEFIL